jgi:hypothetical protein
MTRLARRVEASLFSLVLSVLLPGSVNAREMLALEPFQGKKIRIDGALGEWPSGFEVLGTRLEGDGAKASGLVGYDETYLYLGLKADSARIVRRAPPGPGQDRASLEIYFPAAKGRAAQTHRVDFFPGDPGKLKGAVTVDGQLVPGAEIVEFPHEDGFDLEARLPWSALPEAAYLRTGLRGRLSFYDAVAPGKLAGAVTTSSKKDAAMPPLPLFAEAGLIDQLTSEAGRKVNADRQAFGELTGHGSLEKVALYGNLLSIVGPDYRGGKEYYLSPLDVDTPNQIRRLELVDFNQDGKAEIVLEKRLGSSKTKYRQVVQVLELDGQGAPQEIFLAEVAIVTDKGKIENKVSLASGAKAALVIEQGTYSGFDPETFREPRLGEDIPSALLPWDDVRVRRYVYRNHTLDLSQETKGTPLVRPKSAAVASTSTSRGNTQSAARASSQGDVTALYEAYKSARGPLGPIVAEHWVDVAEDGRPERVVLQDRDLLVLGEGFLGGKSYSYCQLPVKAAGDILSVTPMELTGDGRRELVVQALLRAKAGDKLDDREVVRQVLFVYRVQDGRLTRVFAAEVGRSFDNQQIVGTFKVQSGSGRPILEFGAGRAVGFTQKTYPFPQESEKSGIEPLLLPWGPTKSKRFVFDHNAFAEAP